MTRVLHVVVVRVKGPVEHRSFRILLTPLCSSSCLKNELIPEIKKREWVSLADIKTFLQRTLEQTLTCDDWDLVKGQLPLFLSSLAITELETEQNRTEQWVIPLKTKTPFYIIQNKGGKIFTTEALKSFFHILQSSTRGITTTKKDIHKIFHSWYYKIRDMTRHHL